MTGDTESDTRAGLVTHLVTTSPLGDLTLVARDRTLTGLYYPHHWYMPDRSTFGDETEKGFTEVRVQLAEYFNGERTQSDAPTIADGNDFQRTVWNLVRQVPYGETTTYGQLARELASGTTPQEVGAAVGRNPLCILIPCHRIISSTGKPTGYAGGLRRKQFLLDLESDVIDRAQPAFSERQRRPQRSLRTSRRRDMEDPRPGEISTTEPLPFVPPGVA